MPVQKSLETYWMHHVCENDRENRKEKESKEKESKKKTEYKNSNSWKCGVLSVMVIVIGNEICDPSSIPEQGCLCFTLR